MAKSVCRPGHSSRGPTWALAEHMSQVLQCRREVKLQQLLEAVHIKYITEQAAAETVASTGKREE